MTTEQHNAIMGAYAERFGETHADELMAPNYLYNVEFTRALEEALRLDKPLTIEEVAARLGDEPFHETAY